MLQAGDFSSTARGAEDMSPRLAPRAPSRSVGTRPATVRGAAAVGRRAGAGGLVEQQQFPAAGAVNSKDRGGGSREGVRNLQKMGQTVGVEAP